MPKPLILLENHLGTGARSFIREYAMELKELGYSKFLLEMHSEISHNYLKKELQMILKIRHPDTMIYRATKEMYEMLIALEKNGIVYEFIDPETKVQSIQHIEELKAVFSSGSATKFQAVMESNNQNTKKRDQKIIKTILQQTDEHHGGVIYMGGFMHVHLVQELEKINNDYRFVMFADSREEHPIPSVENRNSSKWSHLYNADFRLNYYKANVTFFNMAYDNHLSFAAIEAACQLTKSRILNEDELPQVARDFEHLMPGHVYSVDEHLVVKASKQYCHPREAIESFVRAGMGVRFFTKKESNGTTRVDVPGLNLKENISVLKALMS